jgi:hypothetical protein
MNLDDALALLLWILGFVLIGAGTILVRRYGPLVRAGREYQLLWTVATMACRAAEQLGETHGWTGQDKKAFALDVLKSARDRLGLAVTDAELEAAIEAAVRELHEEERQR